MDRLQLDKHTSQSFNEELEAARKNLMKMGGVVEQQVREAIKALIEADSDLAQKVIEKDQRVNDAELSLDEECVRILARRHPAAGDLRFVIAVTRAVGDLERIGDHATRIAKHAISLAESGEAPRGYVEIRHIGERVSRMVQNALNAFARLEVDTALSVLHEDEAVDLEYGSAIRELITHMMEDPRTISRTLDVLWSLRSLERVGDLANNISQHVIYLIEGKDVRHSSAEEVEAAVRD